MHRFTGKMEHYYILNPVGNYKIASISHVESAQNVERTNTVLRHFDSVDELEGAFDFSAHTACVPYKDSWYYGHRFFNHPIYNYNVYGIVIDGSTEAIFVTREQTYSGNTALRIVDYYGNRDAFRETAAFWKEQIQTGRYEYIDFYCLGMNENVVKSAGFTKIEEKDTNIIPNYFNPYVRQNIDIWVSSPYEDTLFCLADSDQDRPC